MVYLLEVHANTGHRALAFRGDQARYMKLVRGNTLLNTYGCPAENTHACAPPVFSHAHLFCFPAHLVRCSTLIDLQDNLWPRLTSPGTCFQLHRA